MKHKQAQRTATKLKGGGGGGGGRRKRRKKKKKKKKSRTSKQNKNKQILLTHCFSQTVQTFEMSKQLD